MRHTCAALLIAQGAHPRAMMEHLGHSSVSVTLDRYGHMLPSVDEALCEGLEATYRAAVMPAAGTVHAIGHAIGSRHGRAMAGNEEGVPPNRHPF